MIDTYKVVLHRQNTSEVTHAWLEKVGVLLR